MENSYHSFIENLDRNGLLPQSTMQKTQNSALPVNNEFPSSTNIFATTQSTVSYNNHPAFGNLTTSPRVEIKNDVELINDSNIIDGFDTDILSNSKFKKIDDKTLKLKVKIARLRAELEEHKKLVQQTFLKSDTIQYQKLLEIQQQMETQIQRLVAEYQNRQLRSIVFSPFVKLFNLLKSL